MSQCTHTQYDSKKRKKIRTWTPVWNDLKDQRRTAYWSYIKQKNVTDYLFKHNTDKMRAGGNAKKKSEEIGSQRMQVELFLEDL
jgi:hypothetical protein